MRSRHAGSGTSVVSGPSLLHPRRLGFGDVLVVGLVLQLSAEVLDGFIQAFFQRYLVTHTENYLNLHCEVLQMNYDLRAVLRMNSR